MRLPRRAAVALAVALAAALFTAEAQAADSISFGDQGQTATFGANAVVRIDGSITYNTDCPKPGIKDFFYPATDVYIVDSGTGTGKLQDASQGRPNTIVSATTTFLDEVIAMTAPSGNLEEGDYDVVYDTCQEMYFQYAKIQPYLADFRNGMNLPEWLISVERLIDGTKAGRARLAHMQKSLAAMAASRAEQKRAG